MTKYTVSANGTEFGTYEADTEQAARDLCAQDAGYKSEADMAVQLGQPSELTAVPADLLDELFPVQFATLQVIDNKTGALVDSYTCQMSERTDYERGARANWSRPDDDVRFVWKD